MSPPKSSHTGTLACSIKVRGPLGPRAVWAFDGLVATPDGPDTLLEGDVADQAAVRGAIALVGALGLDLIEVHVSRADLRR